MNYKKLQFLTLFGLLLIGASCGGDGSDPAPEPIEVLFDACGDTTLVANDKRCLYQVSTLTEKFDGSGGLTVDSDGFIYVADFGNDISFADGTTVKKIDPETGEVTLFADGLVGPSGNTFSVDGDLYQANIQGNYISRITPDGEVSIYSSSGYRSPVGVTFNDAGDLFVCNCAGSSIQKLDPAKNSTSFFASPTLLNCPNGLTIDDDGNLYVANFGDGNVVKIEPDGNGSVLASIPGKNNAHIVYGNNVLYVLGRSANRLYEVSLDGEVSLIAGTGKSGNVDGSGTEATFFIPNGIGLSPDGSKIYVVSRIVGEGSPLNPVVVRVIELKS